MSLKMYTVQHPKMRSLNHKKYLTSERFLRTPPAQTRSSVWSTVQYKKLGCTNSIFSSLHLDSVCPPQKQCMQELRHVRWKNHAPEKSSSLLWWEMKNKTSGWMIGISWKFGWFYIVYHHISMEGIPCVFWFWFLKILIQLKFLLILTIWLIVV